MFISGYQVSEVKLELLPCLRGWGEVPDCYLNSCPELGVGRYPVLYQHKLLCRWSPREPVKLPWGNSCRCELLLGLLLWYNSIIDIYTCTYIYIFTVQCLRTIAYWSVICFLFIDDALWVVLSSFVGVVSAPSMLVVSSPWFASRLLYTVPSDNTCGDRNGKKNKTRAKWRVFRVPLVTDTTNHGKITMLSALQANGYD